MSRTTQNDAPRTTDPDQTGIGRRGYLKLGSTLLVGATLGGLMSGTARADHGVLPDPAPADLEVGGGETYDRHVSKRSADYVVATKRELLSALRNARRGDVVYVEDDASIDMGTTSTVGIRDGVTLASGRGRDGSQGGLVYSETYPPVLFKVYGNAVRITGLRIRGPRSDYFRARSPEEYAARGVWFVGDGCEIDNCQLYGWPHAAVTVGAQHVPSSAHVHHCSLHNNQLERLGYGVDLIDGHSLVEHNYFDHNRHSIDGFGYETNGYEARYNLVGPNPVSHAFDMHCLEENIGRGGNRAGGTIHIHHNTFEFTHDVFERAQEAVTIRGVPADGAYIEKNWFAHPDEPTGVDVAASGQAYRQKNLDGDGWQNLSATDNTFGVDYFPPDLLDATSLCRLPDGAG